MPVSWKEIWQVVIAISAGLVTLSAAGSVIVKLFNPYKKLVKDIEGLRRELADVCVRLDRHDDLFRRDLERFQANEETDTMILKALFTLVEHGRTNNSTGLMDATSKEMQAFLIQRK